MQQADHTKFLIGSTPEETSRAALFDQWRGRVFQTGQGCVPLDLVPFSQVAAEIEDFLAEAGEQSGGLDEIRAFVAECRDKAGGEEIVCHHQTMAGSLKLSVYTGAGELVDSLTMRASRLPAPPEDMPRLIATFVRLVRDRPGY